MKKIYKAQTLKDLRDILNDLPEELLAENDIDNFIWNGQTFDGKGEISNEILIKDLEEYKGR